MEENLNTTKKTTVNRLSIGALFFAFAVTILVSPATGPTQRIVAYVYLGLSVLAAIWALLPVKGEFSSNRWLRWVPAVIYFSAMVPWLITFAMGLLSGMSGAENRDQLAVFIVGVFLLFCLVMVATRILTRLTEGMGRATRWISLFIPLLLLVNAVQVFLQDRSISAWGLMIPFFVGTVLIALRRWNPPVDDLPFS